MLSFSSSSFGLRSLLIASVALTSACEVSLNAAADDPTTPANDEQPTTKSAPLPDDNVSYSAPGSRRPFLPGKPAVMPFRGVNLAGGEFGNVLPGVEGKDYQWPTPAEVDYYLAKGMNTFRIGFKWERVQSEAFAELDPFYVAKLDAIVAYATARGASVILNPHNFARYYGKLVGSTEVPSAAFADLWSRLATRHAANPHVMFNLVNEPNNMPTEQWVAAANAAIEAIREVGAPNTIIVPGNGWTGAYSWADDYYGTPNAEAMLDVADPIDNTIFEVHQYLDESAGGVSPNCVSKTIGRERLAPFVHWLRQHGKKGFLGEFAGGDNDTCNAALEDMLASMMESSDVMVGWLWWAAGPAWNDNYPFSLDPIDGQDRPHMGLLAPHLLPTSSAQ